MPLNLERTIRENLPRDIVQPKRAQVYVGFQCHQRCGFCYYKHKCQDQMFQLDFIKKQVDFLLEYGIVDFEITGGEPSEFGELRSLCQYIKDKNPWSKIAVITNGGLWSSNCWDLIDEVLLSYHLGKNSTGYDQNFFPLGSTYTKAFKTQEKVHALGKFLRTNTVLGTFNLNQLQATLHDLVEFKPEIINFLPVNLFDQAGDLACTIDYCKLRPLLKNAIDFIKQCLPSTLIFARYMPFCEMEGYEQHIVGHLQHIYDWFDWNVELSGVEYLDEIRKDGGRSLLKSLGRYGSTSVRRALDARSGLYQKPAKCMLCKFNLLCDGIEKGINRESTSKFAVPCVEPMVKNPLEFISGASEAKYHEIYGTSGS